jgi:uncharacterized protein (UPF0332 family)
MKGRELIPVAKRLASSASGSEPLGRSAVNRAYYAAFGEAEDYAGSRGFARKPGAGSHDRVWRHLESGIRDRDRGRRAARRAVAAQGLLLKDRRQKADYRRGSRISRTEPHDALREAERIIKALDGLTA